MEPLLKANKWTAFYHTEDEKQRLEKEIVGKSTKSIFGGPDKNKIDGPFFIEILNGPRSMETVRAGLERRGYKAREIEKIMGQNFYRVFKEAIG
jgi:microsomal dipeptidase-like Zn-dependent dipeptidase